MSSLIQRISSAFSSFSRNRAFSSMVLRGTSIYRISYQARFFRATYYGIVSHYGYVKLEFDQNYIKFDRFVVPWRFLFNLKGKGSKLELAFKVPLRLVNANQIAVNDPGKIEITLEGHTAEQVIDFLLCVGIICSERYGFLSLKHRFVFKKERNYLF